MIQFFTKVKNLFTSDIPIPEEHQAWIRGKQIEAFKSLLPYGLIASAINSFVVIYFFLTGAIDLSIWFWIGLMGVIALMSAPVVYKVIKSENKVRERDKSALIAPFRDSAILGVGWALGPILLFPGANSTQQLVIVTVCAGMMCGGAYMLSTVPRAAVSLVVAIGVGFGIGVILQGGVYNWAIAAILVVYTMVMVRSTYWNYTNYLKTWLQQVELKQKSEVISLLLKDFEDTASDCLWEIDEKGLFLNVSQPLAERFGSTVESLEEEHFFQNLNGKTTEETSDEIVKLESIIKSQNNFRDIILPVTIKGENRWWSLAGKPVYKNDEYKGYRGVCADVTDAHNAESRINYLAHYDTLTNLPNRQNLMDQLDAILYQQQRNQSQFAVLCLDLDSFKSINDIHGHPVGDSILKSAGKRMNDCLRENDVIARIGGDEFVIILKDIVYKNKAADIAQRLIKVMSDPFIINDVTIQTGTSVGIALCPDDSLNSDALLKKADLALYRAKTDGRGRSCFFEIEMDAAVSKRREMEMDLNRALSEQQFCLHYQPLVDSVTLKPKAFEALLRWDHPTKGRIPPDDFISIAEETRLIVPIGEWIIREGFSEAARWDDHISISINLSPLQIKSSTLLPTIVHTLAQTGLNPNRVEMEITESVLLEESKDCMSVLRAIHDLGIRISLDDFGTGYSSLSYLRKFPFDKIKIDQSFVSLIEESTECEAIVKSIVGLAKNLSMRTTAEGVETQEQIDAMIAEGCSELQGFFFSEPRPAQELESLGFLTRAIMPLVGNTAQVNVLQNADNSLENVTTEVDDMPEQQKHTQRSQ